MCDVGELPSAGISMRGMAAGVSTRSMKGEKWQYHQSAAAISSSGSSVWRRSVMARWRMA